MSSSSDSLYSVSYDSDSDFECNEILNLYSPAMQQFDVTDTLSHEEYLYLKQQWYKLVESCLATRVPTIGPRSSSLQYKTQQHKNTQKRKRFFKFF